MYGCRQILICGVDVRLPKAFPRWGRWPAKRVGRGPPSRCASRLPLGTVLAVIFAPSVWPRARSLSNVQSVLWTSLRPTTVAAQRHASPCPRIVTERTVPDVMHRTDRQNTVPEHVSTNQDDHNHQRHIAAFFVGEINSQTQDSMSKRKVAIFKRRGI